METSLTYEERIVNAISSKRDLKNILSFKMTRYTNFKMRISEGQKDKIKKAFESNCELITMLFKFSDLHGEDGIALTKSQLDILVEACEEKKGMTIRISKTQLAHNVSRIDSIPNWNCFTRFRSWGLIRIG